jgi:methylglutaconyl-CoA hydratase
MEAYVKQYRQQKIGYLEFGHPAANSLPSALLKQLDEALAALAENKDVRVIILQSKGKRAFCGGASLSEMKSFNTLDQAIAFFMGFAHLINRIRELDKFIIARVQGKAVGGAVGLVAACDYALALETAEIKLSELSIGIGPYVIEPAVSRKIGITAFKELSLDAHLWKSALWSQSKGLYNRLYTSTEELDRAIEEIALRLASYPPKANATLRALHWKDTAHWKKLFPQNAKITAQLALEKETQEILKKL